DEVDEVEEEEDEEEADDVTPANSPGTKNSSERKESDGSDSRHRVRGSTSPLIGCVAGFRFDLDRHYSSFSSIGSGLTTVPENDLASPEAASAGAFAITTSSGSPFQAPMTRCENDCLRTSRWGRAPPQFEGIPTEVGRSGECEEVIKLQDTLSIPHEPVRLYEVA
ncbi:unnamed protein product, partial [Dibothriocephalus latus]